MILISTILISTGLVPFNAFLRLLVRSLSLVSLPSVLFLSLSLQLVRVNDFGQDERLRSAASRGAVTLKDGRASACKKAFARSLARGA